MKDNSRRDFIRSCFYVAVCGAGCALLRLCRASGSEGAVLLPGTIGLPERNTPERSVPQRAIPEKEIAAQGGTAREIAAPGAAAQIDPKFQAAYLRLHESGELKKRGEALWEIMSSCRLCPRECGANRLKGEEGFCEATSQLEISSYHPHFGEERSLVGTNGSGTVFFTNCSLRCVFCSNWEISQGGRGQPKSIEELASMMLDLQQMGCHNINIVTPTHYSPHTVLALDVAASKGLRLPLVYNTCGWERLEILKVLDGVVDIYLPDFKYADGAMAAKYSSGADTYPQLTKQALLEMQRQVGAAKPANDGLMYRGLMIRHLVMPNNVGGTKNVVDWIARNLPRDTYVNIMAQYRPMHKAFEYPEIARRLTREEYDSAVKSAKDAGLTNLDIQRWRETARR